MMEGTLDISTRLISAEPFVRRLPKSNILKKLREHSEYYNVPFEIVLGIYLIETACRPYWFRFFENMYLILRICLSFTMNLKIPNITVGRFQIGLGTTLKYHSVLADVHLSSMNVSGYKNYVFILQTAFSFDKNSIIGTWWIAELYNQTLGFNSRRAIRYIGLKYNGYIGYGLLLENIVHLLNKYKITPR